MRARWKPRSEYRSRMREGWTSRQGPNLEKAFCFLEFILRRGEPWEVIAFLCVCGGVFLNTVSTRQSRLEVDSFGSRKNGLKLLLEFI